MRARTIVILSAAAFAAGFLLTQPFGCSEADCPVGVECKTSCNSVLYAWEGLAPWGFLGGAIAVAIVFAGALVVAALRDRNRG